MKHTQNPTTPFLGMQAPSFSSKMRKMTFNTLCFLTLGSVSSNAAIGFTYNSAASNPTAHQYIFNGTDDTSTPIVMTLDVTLWDDSANAFNTAFAYTAGVNGNDTDGSLNVSLDPGDYLCLKYSLSENMTVYAASHPDSGAGTQLATSLAINTANTYGDDIAFIYTPGAGSDFYESGSSDDVKDKNQLGGGTHGQGNTTFTDMGGNDFADIENLLTTESSWFTFSDPNSLQEGRLNDGRNNLPDSSTQGFTWYAANIGTENIAAGTIFANTFGGVAFSGTVPEPSSALMMAIASFALIGKRKR